MQSRSQSRHSRSRARSPSRAADPAAADALDRADAGHHDDVAAAVDDPACTEVVAPPATAAVVPPRLGIGPIAIRLGPAVLATPDVALMPVVPRAGDCDDDDARAARDELVLARVEQLLGEMKIYRAPIVEELAVAFAEDAERDPADPPESLMALLAQLGRCFDCDVMGRDGAGRVVYAYGGTPPPFVQAWLDARAAVESISH